MKGFALALSAIILIGCVIGISYMFNEANEYSKISDGCEDLGALDYGYDCCLDCHKLDKKFFRYESDHSLFGNDIKNCYCVYNKEVQQIY